MKFIQITALRCKDGKPTDEVMKAYIRNDTVYGVFQTESGVLLDTYRNTIFCGPEETTESIMMQLQETDQESSREELMEGQLAFFKEMVKQIKRGDIDSV